MNKKRWAMLLVWGLALCLCACQNRTAGQTEQTPNPEPMQTPAQEAQTAKPLLEAYQEALERLLVDHLDPDGYEVHVDDRYGDVGRIEELEFAIQDVDVDGERELLIRNSTGPMASQHTRVYCYNVACETFAVKGSGTASCRFYNNGTMQDDLSHNQGYSRRFWPFVAYEYNTRAREYKRMELVDAWELEYMREVGMEESYPAEADPEGVGFVYYFWGDVGDNWGDNWADKIPKMSQTEYDAWYGSIFGGAEEIKIDYRPLTRENIQNGCAWVAYEEFLAGDMSLLEPVEPGWPEHLELWRNIFILTGEMEYTYLDLDGDDVDELLLQCPNDSQSYNGVFHYGDGMLQCWQHDEIELSCRDYPLRDGTMVRQYRECYYLFRYQLDGSEKELTSLSALPRSPEEDVYFYQVDGEDVDQAEFERQLKCLVTDQLLEREVWVLVSPQQGDGK